MSIKSINPKDAPTPLAPYSYATKAGNTIYVSGILPVGSNGETVYPGDIESQTRYVMSTIVNILIEAGATLENVVFNQIFLKRKEDYNVFNKVYAEYFPKDPPARYCVCADLVRSDFLVEIASTVYIK